MGYRLYSFGHIREILLIIFLLSLNFFVLAENEICSKIDSCSCQLNDGTEIDLSPLNQNGVNPRFDEVKATTSSNLFSWNPCESFTSGECVNVAVCEVIPLIPRTYISLGTQDSAKFSHDGNGTLHISYTAEDPDNKTLRRTVISLICDPNKADNFTVDGATSVGSANYTMTLVSKHACPVDYNDNKKSISAGWIVFIVLLSLLTSYFVIVSLYNKFVKRAIGMEIIPHYELFADGCKVATACCARKERTKYSSV